MDAVHDPALGAVRSLREVFETLGGDPDPDAALAAAGFDGLPADLLTEAIANYAETAPPEVGEHLSPLLLGASPDAGLGLELLSSAPQVTWEDDLESPVEEPTWADDGPPLEDLDFGAGGDGLDALDALDTPVDGDDLPADDVPTDEVPMAAAAAGDTDLPDTDLADEGWADTWESDTDDSSDADDDLDLPDA